MDVYVWKSVNGWSWIPLEYRSKIRIQYQCSQICAVNESSSFSLLTGFKLTSLSAVSSLYALSTASHIVSPNVISLSSAVSIDKKKKRKNSRSLMPFCFYHYFWCPRQRRKQGRACSLHSCSLILIWSLLYKFHCCTIYRIMGLKKNLKMSHLSLYKTRNVWTESNWKQLQTTN